MTDNIDAVSRIMFTIHNKYYERNKILNQNNQQPIDNRNEMMANIFAQKYDLTDDGKGKKYDTGKPMVGTLCRVFPHALMAVGECIEFGTHKYPDPNNWKKVEGATTRYLDSLMRHLIKHYMGITKDEETNLPHLAHAAWNALAILELELMKNNQEEK